MPVEIEKLQKDITLGASFRGQGFVFHTTWGLFSPTEIDEGSRLLVEHVEVKSTYFSLDLGCGYGALGIPIARMSPAGRVHMVDKDFVAVEYAQKNAKANNVENCEIYLSNGFSRVPDMQFDLIVSNLPAKVGKELLWILLDGAKKHLKSGGAICVVTISGLREFIKRNFRESFGNYEKIKQGRHYTVSRAVKE